MKGKLFLVIAICVLLIPVAFAAPKSQVQSVQQARVLNVERHVATEGTSCCFTNDAPLQSEHYAYDVTVQVGCTTYDGEYATAFDSFPLGIAPGKTVNVQVTKHDLYFSGPATRDLEVPITHRMTNHSCS